MHARRDFANRQIRAFADDPGSADPDLLPDGVSADDDFAISFLASYMAGGSIASIAFWLEDADADIEGDIDRIVELSRAVAPGFMAPLWSQS